MGTMATIGRTGDVRTIWDPTNPQEVESARRQFDDLTANSRYLAFRVAPGGGKGEQIHTFDPSAEKIILAPPMAGG